MMCGNNWISRTVLQALKDESQGKIQNYYYRRLNTMSENYAHLFLCEIEDEDDLEKNWKHIVNLIAVHVQSEVDNLLQRSNFYVWFFVKGEVSRSRQKRIEDNTFSSKKYVIVETEPRSEQERINLIERKLFAYAYSQESSDQKMIKKVIVENFRTYKGNRTFDFSVGDTPARLIVLFAPNGMGKTSFFDAVEWTFTESVDRFGQLKNKNVEGAVLRNTEVDSSEEASVTIHMNNGEWVKRVVPPLTGRTKRDVGKGKLQFSEGSSLEPIVGEDKEKRWANLMLQHHKIDGFIAAANPQELYREWCGLWDPSGEERGCFEQSYKESRQKGAELDKAIEEHRKLVDDYHKLDRNRKFVDKLIKDAEEFNNLPWEAELQIPDFSVIVPEEYVMWCDKIDRQTDICHKQQMDCEYAASYIDTKLEEDVNKYNILVQTKQNIDFEVFAVSEKIGRCQRKMELLALRTDLLTQIETVKQKIKKFSALEDKGQEWYLESRQYFYAPSESIVWNRSMEEAEYRLREVKKTQENLGVSIAEKRAAMEKQEEYKILCSHMNEIEALEIKKEQMKVEAEKSQKEYAALEEQLAGLSHKLVQLEKKKLYSFKEVLDQYLQGSLEYKENDRRGENIRVAIVQLLQEYLVMEEQYKAVERKLAEEEGLANRMQQIAEEARILIDERHLSQCPVCHTLFGDSAVLMQSTYRVSSSRGAHLKEEINVMSQRIADKKSP